MLAFTPTTVPVLNIVLMPDLLWSPMMSPQKVSPVLSNADLPLFHRRTVSYVFFMFDVLVSAPRLHHSPNTELPRYPSCALLLCANITELLISPPTLQSGPMVVSPR